jgi:hypothetical protein
MSVLSTRFAFDRGTGAEIWRMSDNSDNMDAEATICILCDIEPTQYHDSLFSTETSRGLI